MAPQDSGEAPATSACRAGLGGPGYGRAGQSRVGGVERQGQRQDSVRQGWIGSGQGKVGKCSSSQVVCMCGVSGHVSPCALCCPCPHHAEEVKVPVVGLQEGRAGQEMSTSSLRLIEVLLGKGPAPIVPPPTGSKVEQGIKTKMQTQVFGSIPMSQLRAKQWSQPTPQPTGHHTPEQLRAIQQAADQQAALRSPSECLSVVSDNALAAVTKIQGLSCYNSNCIKMLRDQFDVEPAFNRSETAAIFVPKRPKHCRPG